ncbi:maleylpyruvate isomerase family mycothiol-dependent enzyme [Streptomyces sp. NPDC091259]|uniref:maleylpyruvate isomerase family mycothiol-dependent enzyme n=1 Tax=Streptomyces sp. NPDC091259 TaxID=3365976 RepID=UPI003829B9A0
MSTSGDPERDQPHVLLPLLTSSADRLLDSARSLTGEQMGEPSRLPGWTRAHVLVHLARGADSRVRLLTAARTGTDLPQYPDEETRAREIRQGALREAGEISGDLEESVRGVLRAIAEHPGSAWDAPVRWLGGGMRPVRGVLWSLLREQEVHHVDLATTYLPHHWPDAFTTRELHETLTWLRKDPAMPPVRLRADEDGAVHCVGAGTGPLVAGSRADILAWLIGRGDGNTLTTGPAGALPVLPTWRQ